MALINKNPPSVLPFEKVMESFFKGYSPDMARNFFWKMFQCWTIKDCKIKAEISDEEVALFFDQLIDLVAAAYILHQANGAPKLEKGGIVNG
jgi:hypothetical protein